MVEDISIHIHTVSTLLLLLLRLCFFFFLLKATYMHIFDLVDDYVGLFLALSNQAIYSDFNQNFLFVHSRWGRVSSKYSRPHIVIVFACVLYANNVVRVTTSCMSTQTSHNL